MLPFSALNPSRDASQWHNIRKLKKNFIGPEQLQILWVFYIILITKSALRGVFTIISRKFGADGPSRS